MLTRKNISDYIAKQNYDIRECAKSRWMDQKCTPDVLSFVADCIIQYLQSLGNAEASFSSLDIWLSDYAGEIVVNIFKKPDTRNEKAFSEYNKFFQQPMELLVSAGVLSKAKEGRKNSYCVKEYDILYFLSKNIYNSLFFLRLYLEKSLQDSDCWKPFDNFFRDPNSATFNALKDDFVSFIQHNTKIKKDYEPKRIFTKVINPLAFERGTKGAVRGYISDDMITYEMLMYNRTNFMDTLNSKPKNLTRKEHQTSHGDGINPILNPILDCRVARAKKTIKTYNGNIRGDLTEVNDLQEIRVPATQVHHIFPSSCCPQLADCVENLIALTPNQHFSQAHPDNKTSRIERNYQYVCLICKCNSIYENLLMEDSLHIYSFDTLKWMLSEGTGRKEFLDVPDGDFPRLMMLIRTCYDGCKL